MPEQVSWSWMCVVLLNTMNGPGFVTLPQAGRDAGLVGVVSMIFGFGCFAAFVSRRTIAVVCEAEALRDGADCDLASLSRNVLGRETSTCVALGCAVALVACGMAQIILCLQLADALEVRSTGQRCFWALGWPSLPEVLPRAERPDAIDARVSFVRVGCRDGTTAPGDGAVFEVSFGVVATVLLSRLAASLESGDRSRAPDARHKWASAAPQCVGCGCFALAAVAFCGFAAGRASTWVFLGPKVVAAAPPICFNFAFVLARVREQG